MKKLLLLFTFSASLAAFAQKSADVAVPYFPIDEETKLVTYTDVIQVPGIPTDSLYNVAMAWMKTFYASPSQAIKSQSKEDGIIEIKHQFQLTRTEKGQVVKAGLINYYCTLQFRDGRFKYTITKINLQGASYYGIENWLNDEKFAKDETTVNYLVQIDEFMQKLVGSLETEVKPVAPKKEEDW
jgi:hypothetical protein